MYCKHIKSKERLTKMMGGQEQFPGLKINKVQVNLLHTSDCKLGGSHFTLCFKVVSVKKAQDLNHGYPSVSTFAQ